MLAIFDARWQQRSLYPPPSATSRFPLSIVRARSFGIRTLTSATLDNRQTIEPRFALAQLSLSRVLFGGEKEEGERRAREGEEGGRGEKGRGRARERCQFERSCRHEIPTLSSPTTATFERFRFSLDYNEAVCES